MQSSTPKQFLLVHDKPVLYYTLKTFSDAYGDLSIILVLPQDHMNLGQEIIDAWFDATRIRITAGGESRFHSVQKGLLLVSEESIVFVHDGVRCLLTTELIHRCYNKALESGSAIPVLPARDSVRILIEDDDNEAIERNKVMLVQTPQTFHSKLLLAAFEIDYKERFTDEATVVEAYGLKLNLVSGEENNIKITNPADLRFAEWILEDQGMISK